MKTALRLLLLLLAACGVSAGAGATPAGPQLHTGDVARFYALYDATGGRPTVDQLDVYLAQGSDSLRMFARLRRITGERIAAQLQANPAMYEDARRCLAVLPAVERRLGDALRRLSELYPQAEYPPVAIVVGRGRPVGMAGPEGAVISLEALCAADFMHPDPEDRFVHVIAHEYVHTLQPEEIEPGDPGATVLRLALMEGAAEFIGELVSGGVGNGRHAEWTRGREREIETAFVADMHGTDLSRWLFNYRPGSDEPYDLGYWVGYRIVKAYYVQAADKGGAIRRIIAMDDPEAFLRESGWYPGMTLPPSPPGPMEPADGAR